MTSADSDAPGFAESLAVYLKPRVLIVLFLGFSSGLPLALSGSTLLVWMRESGVDLGTIGLFALVGTPYTMKFLWAPVVDALDVPVLARLLGRRRGWLVLVATAADRGDRVPRLLQSGGGARPCRARRAPGRDRVGDAGHRDRRLPHRHARRERTGRRHGVLCRGLSHRHAGLDRRRALRRDRLRERPRLRQAGRLDVRLSGDGAAGRDRHRHDIACDQSGKTRRRQDRRPGGRTPRARVESGARRVLRIPDARRRDPRSRFRHSLQILRRLCRHDDDAVRHRSRLQPHGLRQYRQRRRPCRDADRRLCRRRGRARLAADDVPVDRRHPAVRLQSRFRLAGAGRHQYLGAHGGHHRGEFHRRDRHRDLRRLPVRALQKPAAHGDAICTADRAIRVRAHLSVRRRRLRRGSRRLAAVLSS